MDLEKRIIAGLILIAVTALGINFKEELATAWRTWTAVPGPPVYTVVPNAFGIEAGQPIREVGSDQLVGKVLSIRAATSGVEIRIQPEPGVHVGAGSSVTVFPGSVATAPVLRIALSGAPDEPGRLTSSVAMDVPAGILEPAARWPAESKEPAAKISAAHTLLADTHLRRAREALRRGNPKEASVLARSALRLSPSDIRIRMLLADANYLQGRPSAALEFLSTFRDGADTSRTGAIVHIMKGSAAFAAGLYADAARNLEIGLDLAGQHRMSEAEWTAAFNLAAAFRRMGRLDSALKLLELGPADDHDAKLLRADLLFRLNREEESLAILDELSKTSLLAAINYGITLRRSDRVDESISILSWLAREWPNQAVIQFHLARSYEKSGAVHQARTAYLVAADAETDSGLQQLYRDEAERLAQ